MVRNYYGFCIQTVNRIQSTHKLITHNETSPMADNRSPFESINQNLANMVVEEIKNVGCGKKLDKKLNIFARTTSCVINTFFAEPLQNRLKEKIFAFALQTKPKTRAKAQQLLQEHPELYDDHEFITQLIVCYTTCGQKEAANSLKNYLPKKLIESKTFQKELFFLFTAYGQQEAAEELLTRHPGLLLETIPFITDGSGRTFKNITAFQYALWAKDSYMAAMMLSHFERLKLINGLSFAKQQSDVLEKYGLSYEHDDKRIKIKKLVVDEKHFDFAQLTSALEAYNFNERDPDSSKIHWQQKVGVAQRHLPMHVIHEYCKPSTIYHSWLPFKQAIFTRSTRINHDHDDQSLYRLIDSNLGIEDGLCKVTSYETLAGCHPFRTWGESGSAMRNVGEDLVAIRELDSVRTKDVEEINAYLAYPTSHSLPDHLKHQYLRPNGESIHSNLPR